MSGGEVDKKKHGECTRGWGRSPDGMPASLLGGLGKPLHAEWSTLVICQNAKIPTAFVGNASTPPTVTSNQSTETQTSYLSLKDVIASLAQYATILQAPKNLLINMDSSDQEDGFASPSEQRNAARAGQQAPKTQNSRYDAEEALEAREAALRRELEGVRNINEVIEGVIGTLERAKGNMGVRIPHQPTKY